jgi:hypothetical protein
MEAAFLSGFLICFIDVVLLIDQNKKIILL